jgi:hexosaminidase
MAIALIPMPQRLRTGEGHFVINPTTRLIASASAQTTAEYLAGWLRNATGFPLPIQSTETDEPDAIHLRLNPANSQHGAEGYSLRVTTQRIEIEAADPAGLFYGAQTLRQLLPASLERTQSAPNDLNVPAVQIEDRPRFAWRGLLLDVGRHFFPVSFVKKLLEVMALYKFNRLQLHLTDDQGWRIEIKSYPRLTEVGSQRSKSQIPYSVKA